VLHGLTRLALQALAICFGRVCDQSWVPSTDVYAKAASKLRSSEITTRDAADDARKASAYSALWLFVSLLTGAFDTSLAATFGGRRRDA